MKILLASNGRFAIKDGFKTLGIPPQEIRIGYITTASKGSKDSSYVKIHKRELDRNKYFYEEFDIEGKSKEEIFNFFADKNVIHVEGGNAFYLIKTIRETHFDEVLKTLLDKGLAYVGVSAGAYVMCPSVEVADWRGHKRFGLEDLTGLNYVPYVIKAHWTDDMAELYKERINNTKHPLRLLRDGQGILIENGVERFVGEGEEVKVEELKEKMKERGEGPSFGRH